MKKATIILTALVFVGFSITSCQKAPTPESKQETQVQQPIQQAQKEEVKQSETKPSETKPEVQPQQPPSKPEVKEEKKEKPKEIKPSPLTKEEQKFLWKKDTGPWNTPNAFNSKQEAIKYLRILLKGNHANIVPFDPKSENYSEFGDSGQREVHADLICTAIHALVFKAKPSEAIDTVIEVFQKKTDYPKAYACAAKYIGIYTSREGRNKKIEKIIPQLKEATKHNDPKVRLEAADALLASGEADIALPVLDELVEKEGYASALYLLFTGPGKIIDERGYKIVEKALNNTKAEVRIHAVKLLLDAKKITKGRAEEIALGILKELKDNTLKNYGLMLEPNKIYSIIALPSAGVVDVKKAEEREHSDARACETTMHLLGDLKSKRAIPLLKHIHEKNTGLEYVCHENLGAGGGIARGGGGIAENTLKRILEDRGNK